MYDRISGAGDRRSFIIMVRALFSYLRAKFGGRFRAWQMARSFNNPELVALALHRTIGTGNAS
jgi:hypothetical protein